MPTNNESLEELFKRIAIAERQVAVLDATCTAQQTIIQKHDTNLAELLAEKHGTNTIIRELSLAISGDPRLGVPGLVGTIQNLAGATEILNQKLVAGQVATDTEIETVRKSMTTELEVLKEERKAIKLYIGVAVFLCITIWFFFKDFIPLIKDYLPKVTQQPTPTQTP